jgi:hypothetical protein
MFLGGINYEVYIARKVGTISTHMHYSMGMFKPSLPVSDNVLRVGASVKTCVELENALNLFEQQTRSQMRDT